MRNENDSSSYPIYIYNMLTMCVDDDESMMVVDHELNGVQVSGVRQWHLRGLLIPFGVLYGGAPSKHHVTRLDHLLLRSDTDIRDIGGGDGVGGDHVPSVQRRQGCDMEQTVRGVQRVLQEGHSLHYHHLRFRCLLYPALPSLLLQALQLL